MSTSSICRIGSRRELFVDRFLIERLEGGATLRQHRPVPREVVLSDDRAWESSIGYFAALEVGGEFRLYYRAAHHGTGEAAQGEAMCLAQSRDGITWEKPVLGLFEYEGSAANNLVLGGDLRKFPATRSWRGQLGSEIAWRGDFVPFLDSRPGVPPQGRYKALIRGCRGFHQIASRRWDYGMYPFESPDGLHWTLLADRPVITRGKFDSQNLAFWDAAHGRYVAFVRDTWGGREEPSALPGEDAEWVSSRLCRDVRVAFSEDFIHWSDPVFVSYPGDIPRQLYTNAIAPYPRAPHLLLGFPTVFYPEGSQTEPILMASRDGGCSFTRWPEALIPREAPHERDGNRSNYLAAGLVRGNAREFYLYATEGYKEGPSRRLRRFTCRVDGFVSVSASDCVGWLTTPPLVAEGRELWINAVTSPGGGVRAALLDEAGAELPGFGLKECVEFRGDAVDTRIGWKASSPGSALESGRPIRLRFELRAADLYSLQFRA